MTAPFQSDTPDIITASHGQVVRAWLEHADLEGALPLDLTGVRLTWDETAVPRATARLECGPIDSTGIDPRVGGRVTIAVGYIRPGGLEDVHEVLDLGIRRTTLREEDHTVTMECAGDEALVIDASPVVDETVTSGNHTGAIKDLVYRSINPRPRWSDPAGILGGAVTVDVLTDRWTAVMDVADRIDAVVYDAGLREWVMEPRPTLASTPSHTVVVGENGTVLRAETSVSRDDWANHVTMLYEWRDAADVDQRIEGTAYIMDGGPFDVTGPAGKKTLVESREVSTTQAEAGSVARTVLTRAVSRATRFEVSAIAAYWLRPGMTLGVQLGRDLEPVLHLVSRVTFDPIEGTMDVLTRQPLPVFPFTGTVEAPEPPPPPATQTYVSTWTANGSEAYLGSGNRWTSTDQPVQGYVSGLGNNQGIAIFTAANSTGDDSGVSISTALSGLDADDITKVEVYLYANHWWYSAGGTARIGYYDGTAIPTTFTGAKPYITVKDWPKNSGRWVNITSAALKRDLVDGSARGVTVGPGASSSGTYYGRFDGVSDTNKPKLRITYKKAV